MTQKQRDIKRKLAVLEYAEESGNVAKTCRRFGISRQCFYNWLRAYERRGEAGLVNRGALPPEPLPADAEAHRGEDRPPAPHVPLRADADRLVPGALPRLQHLHARGLQRARPQRHQPAADELPQALDAEHALPEAGARPPRPGRRQVPASGGFRRPQGAGASSTPPIDDATRIRALKVYEKHNQASADRLHRPRRRALPLPHPHRADRQRARVPDQVPLARRGPGHPARLHQAERARTSTARWSAPTSPTSSSSTSSSTTRTTSTSPRSSRPGRSSTTSTGPTAGSEGSRRTRS